MTGDLVPTVERIAWAIAHAETTADILDVAQLLSAVVLSAEESIALVRAYRLATQRVGRRFAGFYYQRDDQVWGVPTYGRSAGHVRCR